MVSEHSNNVWQLAEAEIQKIEVVSSHECFFFNMVLYSTIQLISKEKWLPIM